MKQWQRITGLLAAGAGLVVLAVWLSRMYHPGTAAPATGKTPGATNAPAAAAAARPGAKAGTATNALAGRPGARTGIVNPPPGAARPVVVPGRTNPVSPAARAGAKTGTNAAAMAAKGGAKSTAKSDSAAQGKSGFMDKLRTWQDASWFYPVVFGTVFGLILVGTLLVRFFQSKKEAAAPPAGTPTSLAAQMARRKTSSGAIHSCNVLQVSPDAQKLWQFNARNGGFTLNREQAGMTGESLPAGMVAKDWRAMFQRKLNIAWLPNDQVFLRVAQFPVSNYEETVAMVELQLEKLSPIPVPQIVWSLYVLSQPRNGQQTVIVLIVARNVVEEFLGRLEGQGFLADRLEVPALDQLQATGISGDGTWIYPSAGNKNSALAAWWYGGVLQNLDFVTLPPANRAESLKEQLMQTAWTGEMEGWLTGTPRFHLVADAATTAEWEPALREGLEQTPEVAEPLPAPQLAAQTATRATLSEAQANLLPLEFATRYRQQFVDRLWMGGLVGVVGLYLIGVAIYFVALEFALFRTRAVEAEVAVLGPTYTNALQLKAKYEVLKDRQDLKYAALDCWKAVAELLPESVTLEGFNFTEGKRLNLTGTAPTDKQQELLQFERGMRKYMKDGQLLFDPIKGESLSSRTTGPGSQTVSWTVTFELKRGDQQ